MKASRASLWEMSPLARKLGGDLRLPLAGTSGHTQAKGASGPVVPGSEPNEDSPHSTEVPETSSPSPAPSGLPSGHSACRMDDLPSALPQLTPVCLPTAEANWLGNHRGPAPACGWWWGDTAPRGH